MDSDKVAMVSLMSYDITDRVKYLLIAFFFKLLKMHVMSHKFKKEHNTGNNKIVILLLKILV